MISQVEHLGNPNTNNFAKPNEGEQAPNDVEMKNIEDKSHSKKDFFTYFIV
jgi:hypothetical protein